MTGLRSSHLAPVRRHRWAALLAILAAAMTGGAVSTAVPAAAAPVARSGSGAEIARLDGQVARAQADLAAADADAAAVIEDFNDARLSAESLERSALSAAKAQDIALEEQAQARRRLADVISQAYRQAGGPALFVALAASDDVAGFLDRAGTVEHLGAQGDIAVQRVDATAAVAAARGEAAGTAAVLAADALAAVSDRRDAAEREQRRLDAAAAALIAERDSYVSQLADLQGTSMAAEQSRQDQLDSDRQAAANRAALVVIAPVGAVPVSPGNPASTAAPAPVGAPNATVAPSAVAAPSAAVAAPVATPAPTPAPSRSLAPPPTTAAPAPSTRAPAPTTSPATAPAPPAPAPTTPTAPPETRAPPARNPAGSADAGAGAVAWARTQLGKAYLWGAAGPDSYDCSGLVMRAWGSGGVQLPHSSRAQYSRSALVDREQVRPGDLIFWASDTSDPSTIYHVALYSGDGQMIEAPNSRNVVREVAVRWSGTMAQVGRP